MVRSYRNSSRSSVARETAQRIGRKKLRIAAKIDELAKECNYAAHVLKHRIQRAVLHHVVRGTTTRTTSQKGKYHSTTQTPNTDTTAWSSVCPYYKQLHGILVFFSAIERTRERERERERSQQQAEPKFVCLQMNSV